MSFSYLMQRYLIAIDQLISEKPWKLRPRWGSCRCTIENSLLVRYQMLILFANPYSSWRHWNWIVAKIVHSVENYKFFLSFRFYVKCLFWNFLSSENSTFHKESKFRSSKCVKMAVFGFLKCLKLISQKIWVEENPEISTLCLRISLPIRFYVESSNSKPLK